MANRRLLWKIAFLNAVSDLDLRIHDHENVISVYAMELSRAECGPSSE